MTVWKFNVPFEKVSRELIEQLSERSYTYEEYLHVCPLMNQLDNYWNLALMDGDEIVAFFWGILDPLERNIHMVRGTINQRYFSYKGKVVDKAISLIKEWANQLNFKRVYFITTRWKVFEKKFGDKVEVLNTKVVEVL